MLSEDQDRCRRGRARRRSRRRRRGRAPAGSRAAHPLQRGPHGGLEAPRGRPRGRAPRGPASVLPPGEATASRTSAGMADPQQLGGARRSSRRPARGPAPGRGRRRRRRRRAPRRRAPGRRARSPSPRSRRRTPRRASSTTWPSSAEHLPHLGRRPSPATQSTPAPDLDADVRHHPQHVGARERRPSALQRRRPEQRDDRLRRRPAPARPRRAAPASPRGRRGRPARPVSAFDDGLAAELLGELRGPAGAGVGEQHRRSTSPGPAARHRGGHVSRSGEADDHRPAD